MTGNGNHVTAETCFGKFVNWLLVIYFSAGFSHLEQLCRGAFFRPPPPGCHLSYNTVAAVVGEDVQCLIS